MALDFSNLTIDRVIIHDVPRWNAAGDPCPTLSEVESSLDADLKVYIKDRLTASAGSTMACDVIFDPKTSSPSPQLITDYLVNSSAQFVSTSCDLARHLYSVQKGNVSEGLLVVIDCRYGRRTGLAILKLEKQTGVRIDQTVVGGQRTYQVERIRDLILTKSVKVFKAGVFIHRGPELSDVDAVVSDHQRGDRGPKGVADFFLINFLGCCLTEVPQVTTRRFVAGAQKFINESVTDPEQKARYYIAILAEMNSASPTFSVRDFASNHLDLDVRKDFVNALLAQDIPDRQIDKDTTLVKGQIKRILIEFESGISVLSTKQAYDDRIRLTTLENGNTRLALEDKLTRVQGSR